MNTRIIEVMCLETWFQIGIVPSWDHRSQAVFALPVGHSRYRWRCIGGFPYYLKLESSNIQCWGYSWKKGVSLAQCWANKDSAKVYYFCHFSVVYTDASCQMCYKQVNPRGCENEYLPTWICENIFAIEAVNPRSSTSHNTSTAIKNGRERFEEDVSL